MNNSIFNSFIKECHLNLNGILQEQRQAKQYLLKRKLLEKSINSHIIGYCNRNGEIPFDIQTYGSELKGKQWNLSYFIRGKIIIPIFDEFNAIVGFATRTPTFEKGHTWWNMPRPFYKGNHLFLLNKAKTSIFNKNKVYVVEGYMDALLLYQNGLTNVVGVMGTALTLRKIALLRRYCSNICLCFDSDVNQAGQNAQVKSIASLASLEMNGDISVIDKMPIGIDPADFIAKNSIADFLAMERKLSIKEMQQIINKIKEK